MRPSSASASIKTRLEGRGFASSSVMRASGLGGEADPARTPDSKVHPRFRVRQRQPPPNGRVRGLGSLQSVEAIIRGGAPSQNPVMPMVRSKKPVRLGLAAALLLAAAVAAIALFSSDEPSGPQAPGDPAEGFGVGNWPPASWRPYADDSPFNQRLPANPRLLPSSSQVVARLTANGGPSDLRAGVADIRRGLPAPHLLVHHGRSRCSPCTARVPSAAARWRACACGSPTAPGRRAGRTST